MNRRLRSLERVLNVRERLRDAASAVAISAEMKHTQAESVREAACGAVDALYADAPARMSAATSIDDLMQLDAERLLSQHLAREAAKVAEKTRIESEKMRDKLRERSRDVRVFEKAIETTRTLRDVSLAKREQVASDDLTGWRFAG